MRTRIGSRNGPAALSLRIASRAPAGDASGPSVRAAFGFASVPLQASLPSGETYKSAAVAAWPANARAMAVAIRN